MRVEIPFLASIWASEGVLVNFPVPSRPDAHPCTADPRRLGKVENWPPRRPQTTKWMPETDSPPKKTSRMNLPHILRCWRDVCGALFPLKWLPSVHVYVSGHDILRYLCPYNNIYVYSLKSGTTISYVAIDPLAIISLNLYAVQ